MTDSNRLGKLRLPFEYLGPVIEDHHGLILKDYPTKSSRTALHSLIGAIEPSRVHIEVARDQLPDFVYEGRVKIFRENLILMDPDPATPAAEWNVLEEVLDVSFIEQHVRLSITMESGSLRGARRVPPQVWITDDIVSEIDTAAQQDSVTFDSVDDLIQDLRD